MRVLLSTTANEGHFGPLVPLARACAAAGDEVRVAAPASYAQAVRRAGLDHVPFGEPAPELVGPVMSRLPTLGFEEANVVVLRDVFGRIDAQAALPGLLEAVTLWPPDVVVREPAELGSLAAAVRAGVPHVQVAIGMQETSRLFARHTTEPLGELARLAGLPDDALREAAAAEPLLSSVPEDLDRAGDEGHHPAAVLLRHRDEPAPASTDPLPVRGDSGWPLVYVTFGSVTGSLPFAMSFRQALDALADLPVRVFMTVGRQVDLAALGPLPANAHVEGWWPQQGVLDVAAAMVGHGGFGTTMGALGRGVPQVVVPLFSLDQAVNARHVAAAGAGLAVEPGPEGVVEGCRQVPALLADPALRDGARTVAEAIGALPTVEAAVEVVHVQAARGSRLAGR